MYNTHAIEKVLAGLCQDNDLIVSGNYPLRLEDFCESKYKAIYMALYNLYTLGNSHIDIHDIEGYFKEQKELYQKFVADGGMDMLYQIYYDDTPLNFEYNYSLVKKHSLLNDLNKAGIDTTDLYDKSLPPDKFEKQMALFNAMDVEDIFKFYEGKISNVQSKYETFLEKTCITVADGLEELYKQLATAPEVGLPLEGDIYNTVARGARLKKLYIDSASTGGGKSRRMVGNACKLAFPLRYDTKKKEWVNTGIENKVLYITTELEHAEVQTMVIAYVSGVDEDKILNHRYKDDEQERVELAIKYIENYDNLIIEFLPNPSFASIQTIIRKHCLQDDVKFVFYDYIHISTGLTQGRDKQTRDDIILMLLSDTLKNLANELNIHISSATQLNGTGDDGEARNESLIRGARSIIDKADVAGITLRLTQAEEELGSQLAFKLGVPTPNFITDIYKNRRGKWTNIRIWRYVDLGTCRVVDCFITNRKNEVLDFSTMQIQVQQAPKTGFVVDTRQSE